MDQSNREYWVVFSYDNCNYEGTPLYICKTKESAFEAFHKAISESECFRDIRRWNRDGKGRGYGNYYRNHNRRQSDGNLYRDGNFLTAGRKQINSY